MNLLVEILVCFLQCVWLWLVAIFKAVVPVSLQPHKDVSGWVVLVTGAGSGLGRLMSLRFAAQGCRLVLWDINEDGNQETAELVKEATPAADIRTYTVDLASREEIYQAADRVKEEVGDVDILVNNAGIVTGTKFLDSPDGLNVKTMDVNCNAHFWTVKSFLPAMLEKNNGHIVSIASAAGLFGVTGLADYCASKFAAVGFHESLRGELEKLGKTGVKTTVVCPFYINTGMFAGAKTRFPAVLRFLEPSFVVNRIIEAVLTDQAMLCVPKSVYFFYILRGIIPISVNHKLGQLLGVSSTMDEFVGRNKSK
ncbi:retinol dehydrogenase 10 [Plakobranchus ocellatus]|uniref:Retinol dehydrogenase 10 n=1 Tax=Plakobranchus ocellatus TaxID=259542 RepID=A0AAV3Z2R2_9GAST|nr:retinol dehydrogenase 10 [Plakobranchus ocellatus]